jgi:galactokinase
VTATAQDAPRRSHDQVLDRLVRLIVDGAVKPGQPLPSEMDLCVQCGVSRTVVREAIQTLAAKGMVKAKRRVGTVVQAAENWTYLDGAVLDWARAAGHGADFDRALLEARLTVEPAVAALAAERATAQEVAELDRACQTMAASDDDEERVHAALDFHLGLFAASHNAVFRQLVTAIRSTWLANLRRARGFALSQRRTVEAHRAVVEAVRLRQPDEARRAMETVLRIARDEMAADPAPRRWPAPPRERLFPAGLEGDAGAARGAAGLAAKFRNLFGTEPRLYRAPGRVNLIGEHTDHAGGFALPAALDRSTWVAAAPRRDRRVRIHTDVLSEAVEFDLDEADPRPRREWSDYVRGTAIMLERAGYWLTGADLLLGSDVPVGAGLGSSAALEVAVGYALADVSGLAVDPVTLARCAQRAEDEFAGIRCGPMDQFASCRGQAGHAMLLDCRSLEHRALPLPPDVRLVVCNTMVRHELASSEYNERRQDCERGAALLSETMPGLVSLRDVSPEDLERFGGHLPDRTFRRCRHVVTENARVLRAAEALGAGDSALFGRLMGESHRSLRNDYQVSCPELDAMVEMALEVEGVFGARMTGAGFGGCTVNLVRADAVERFAETVGERYHRAIGRLPQIFTFVPGPGVGRDETA